MSDDARFAARPRMTDEVLYARDGHLGRILLNRPEVINALTGQMMTPVLAQLQDWARPSTASPDPGSGQRRPRLEPAENAAAPPRDEDVE